MKPGRHEPLRSKKGVFIIGSHVNDLKEFDFYNQFLGGNIFREQTARTLKHAALLVKKATLKELRSAFPESFKREGHYYVGGGSGYKRRDGSTKRTYKDSMSQAVRVGRLKGGANHQELKVHIMGTRGKGSGTYRLRFFEGGAMRRHRGSIPGHRFFMRGYQSVNIWEEVKKNINEWLSTNGWQ